MSATGASLAEYLRDRAGRINAALERYLPSPPACPAIVSDAMRYSLFAGGKRFRPILALAAAEAVAPGSAGAELALPAACAIEMIHTYSLIHDDLPAMDNDSLRRGRPTAHVVYGEGIAILAGDGLLTEAFALLAREPSAAGLDPAELAGRKLRAVAAVAGAAGVIGMVGGQAIDLQGAPPDGDALRELHARKTGALIRAAATAGAIMAGATEPVVDAVHAYAVELGLAFQIVDDILDVEGATDHLGKTAGKDAALGKQTYVALYGVARSRELAAEAAARGRAALERAAGAGIAPARLLEIADWAVARTR